jgi:hypothetical protein
MRFSGRVGVVEAKSEMTKRQAREILSKSLVRLGPLGFLD